MGRVKTNKKKIINDPVYGFIKISFEGLFDLIEHSYFQRLRRIKQLGLTYFVYPGATHTRFQHALGSFHLMGMAIQVLRSKGVEITTDEEEAALSAILLHDIGHGPFSHALEESIVPGIHHEALSLLFMHALNKEFKGRLDTAIQIFTGQYPKQFLHQLITGQLDMDRLDYLKRDSFFTGVTEGVIGSDRIVRMLNVVNDQLVVDHKGIYSIEKFLIARRLMYWQVYLHKAVLSSEMLLLKLLQRARKLAGEGVELFCTPSLRHFLYRTVSRNEFFGGEKGGKNPELSETVIGNLEKYAGLDDNDIMASAKVWADHPDHVLSTLCKKLKNRDLSRIEIRTEPFPDEYIKAIRQSVRQNYGLQDEDIGYLVHADTISNYAYSSEDEQIQILYHDGTLRDITTASDMLDLAVLSKTVRKYFLYYPKDVLV
ncbi:MAG: phosphohydrolase [Bacteroides sp. SM1_62]|nr:MAG: phosphohydrolase [Bacteroides sp. SM23_62]KPL25871.1 MAG: phosphohydrolase [Bacteroides sp. SM1_62]